MTPLRTCSYMLCIGSQRCRKLRTGRVRTEAILYTPLRQFDGVKGNFDYDLAFANAPDTDDTSRSGVSLEF